MTETKTKHTPGPWKLQAKSVTATVNYWRRDFLVIGSDNPASIRPAFVPNFSGNRNDMSRYVSIMADTIKDVQAAIAKAESNG